MYSDEVKKKWGHTAPYNEFKNKNCENSKESIMDIFVEISKIRKLDPDHSLVQSKIKKLQDFISKHYYTCTNEILGELGQLYIEDERYKKNIDNIGGDGLTQYVSEAIKIYINK